MSVKSIMTQAALVASAMLLVLTQVKAASEFEQWKSQQQQSFQEYKDKRDKEFTAFLKMHWKAMQLQKGFVRDQQPKPVTMPVAKPKPEIKPPPDMPVVKPEPVVKPPPPPVVVKPEPPPSPATRPKGHKISVDYYGSTMVFHYDRSLKTSIPSRMSKKVVSEFWSVLGKSDYEPLLEQIHTKIKAWQLNDWAVALLAHKISQKIYPGSNNSQALLSWFLLAKLDYSARIAYDDHAAYLLVPSRQQLYSVSYFTFDGVRYYAIRFDGTEQKLGQVYTYEGHYPGASKALDMTLTRDFITDNRLSTRELTFNFENRKRTVKVQYGLERVNFFNTYPQMDLDVYFASSVDSVVAKALLEQLAEQVKGMTELQAVNFLLRFVQTSFEYKTDEGQFGKENYLFPEETLHYPYSDCEDRSVLFAWLVKSLLDLDVIGLDYPGHVATAVHFNSNVEGDAVTYNGKRYVVSDPTYINAVAGMTMPDYKSNQPGVIKIQ